MQGIHELTLIFVQTLYLYVKDGIRINDNAVVFFDILGHAFLILLFDSGQLFQYSSIIFIGHKTFKGIGISLEFVTDQFGNQIGQTRIGLVQPTSVGNTIGDILEFFGCDGIEIIKDGVFQNLTVELGNTVDGMACDHSKICHLHDTVIDDGHSADFVAIHTGRVHFLAEASVDFFDDLIDTGELAGEHINLPAFQCFAHNSMVGVGDGSCNDIPGLIPVIAAFIQHNTHQLGNSQYRMGVIQMNGYYIRQIIQCTIISQVTLDDILYRSRYEEILLAQTQTLAFGMVILRIKYTGNAFGQCFLLHGSDIFAGVKGYHIKVIGGSRPQS